MHHTRSVLCSILQTQMAFNAIPPENITNNRTKYTFYSVLLVAIEAIDLLTQHNFMIKQNICTFNSTGTILTQSTSEYASDRYKLNFTWSRHSSKTKFAAYTSVNEIRLQPKRNSTEEVCHMAKSCCSVCVCVYVRSTLT